MSMQHTYLRYECADAFGLINASASSKIPPSNSTLAFASNRRECPIVLTTAGSHCAGFHLRTTNPTVKFGHREEQSGGVGTGKALNSDQIVCVDVSTAHDDECRVATGWVDGAVRVFTATTDEINTERGKGLIHSLISEEDEFDEEFSMREPLVLNGHSGSPIRCIAFDGINKARLASGSSDGAVVLWDVVEESGLFRLLGHRGAVTDIHFAGLESGLLDTLVSSSLDGLVKIWDLKGQCCMQTIASHRGKVWTSACLLREPTPNCSERARLFTGDDDGLAKVWSMNVSSRHRLSEQAKSSDTKEIAVVDDSSDEESTECCRFMGTLGLPVGLPSTNERVSSIRFHPGGKFVGILHANSKSIHVYTMRSPQETQKRKQRRMSRRRQKAAAKEGKTDAVVGQNKKRGILDDEDEQPAPETVDASKITPNPEKIEATDEFEYFGTFNASHKIRTFVFVPWKESGSSVRVVCSLTTNALELLALQQSKNRYVWYRSLEAQNSHIGIVFSLCSFNAAILPQL